MNVRQQTRISIATNAARRACLAATGASLFISAGWTSALTANAQSTEADVAVTKQGPATASAGDDISYSITVRNNGPNDAQGVMLSDALPAGMTLVSLSQTSGPAFSCSTSGNSISCSITTLVNGAESDFTLTAHIASGTPNGTMFTNGAQVSARTSDPNSGNNQAQASTTVVAPGSATPDVTLPATLPIVGVMLGFGVVAWRRRRKR